jgi:hypothetical protein
MERPGEFLSLLESLRMHFNPDGALEDAIVQQIADVKWKEVRLARYEAAGVTERLYASLSAASRKLEEQGWTNMHLGKAVAHGEIGTVDAETIQNQTDLVERLDADGPDEENEEYLEFVARTMGCPSDATFTTPEEEGSKAKEYLRGLSEEERDALAETFRSRMAAVLKQMYEKRAKGVVLESSFDRSLVPEEADLQKIMRYSSHLSRQEERYVKMLLTLQEARQERG